MPAMPDLVVSVEAVDDDEHAITAILWSGGQFYAVTGPQAFRPIDNEHDSITSHRPAEDLEHLILVSAGAARVNASARLFILEKLQERTTISFMQTYQEWMTRIGIPAFMADGAPNYYHFKDFSETWFFIHTLVDNTEGL